jgi:hypothetical protein
VDLDLSQTVRAAGPYILPVIGASILAGIGIAIGFFLLIVPGLILLTYWCLIVPFIVITGAGVFESFGRSMRNVRGYAWRVFGTYVLVFLILIVFDIVIGLILLFLPGAARNAISSIVSGTLVAPFLALVVTLVYYRLTAAHGATDGPGEAQWPPAGPDATYPGPGTEPGSAYPGPGATSPGAGSTSPGAGSTSPGPGPTSPGPGPTSPGPDIPPAGPGSAPTGPGVPPTEPGNPA